MKSIKLRLLIAGAMCTLLLGINSANANCELFGQDLVVAYSEAKRGGYIGSKYYGLPGKLGYKGKIRKMSRARILGKKTKLRVKVRGKVTARARFFSQKPLKHGWTINFALVQGTGKNLTNLKQSKLSGGLQITGKVKNDTKFNFWITKLFLFGPQDCTPANKPAMIRSMFR